VRLTEVTGIAQKDPTPMKHFNFFWFWFNFH
jgi:hypothetical protein